MTIGKDDGRRGWRGFALALWRDWKRNKSTDAAAALTFYGILALCPFVLFLVAAGGLIVRPEDVEVLGAALARQTPPAVSPILLARLAEITSRPRVGMLTFSALAAVWSSTTAVVSLVDALNGAYGVLDRRPHWRVYGLALVTLCGAALLALLASLLAIAAPLAAKHVANPWRAVIGWLRLPVATSLMVVVWAILYYVLPNVTQSVRLILPGAVVGVLVWLGATLGFSFYVAHFGNFGITYGALGGLVILLLWMWLSSLALILGAEINAVVRQPRSGGDHGLDSR